MLRFIKKHPVWLALILLIVGPASLNISGFCWTKPGWLSDEEQIKLAVERIALNPPNHNYLDMHFREKMGERAFYESFHIPGKEHSSYETLYSTYYDPRLWVKFDGGHSREKIHNFRMVIEEFLRENPNCCKPVRWESKEFFVASFPDVVLGEVADIIEVRYKAPFIENETRKLVYLNNFKQYVIVSNCGRTTSPAF